jgi:hypothetical protein
MTKLIAVSAFVLATLVLPASSLAAPLPEGSDPVLTISPAPAVVPTTTVGNQSPTVEFILHNESAEEAAINKVTLEGEDAGEFSFGGSNCNGTVLQPGAQCSAGIALKPSGVGAKKTTLAVLFEGGRPAQGFEVSGISASAHLSFQPASYDFGLVPVHSEAQRTTVQIENDGAAATQFGQLNFTGGNPNGFWFGNSDCYGRWMAPGDTCSVEIDFSPNDPVPYAIQLQASSGSETFTADLSGAGAQPIVTAAPNPADFGAATVGATSAIETIVVSNSGNGPANFFIGIVAGGDSGSFELLDEDCSAAPLLPGGSCTAHLRFVPQSAGPKLARLAFFGDTEGGAMVALQGEGIAPAVTLVPSEYDFGSLAAGSRSVGRNFAVRNEGSTALDLDGVAIVGVDLDQFALAGDECTGVTLAPGAQCLVQARFTPDSAGTKTAKLRIGSEVGAFVATLTGTANGAVAAGGSAGLGPHAFDHAPPPPPSRPWRQGRHRRFVRGESLPGARVQRPHRAQVRASTVPR